LAALFDLRFDSYVTPKVISLLYILGMIAIVIGYITSVITGFNASVGVGLLTLLILGPIGVLLALTFLRVILEYYLALVRLSGDFREWRKEWRASGS
jgi:thiamine transporter ThiT